MVWFRWFQIIYPWDSCYSKLFSQLSLISFRDVQLLQRKSWLHPLHGFGHTFYVYQPSPSHHKQKQQYKYDLIRYNMDVLYYFLGLKIEQPGDVVKNRIFLEFFQNSKSQCISALYPQLYSFINYQIIQINAMDSNQCSYIDNYKLHGLLGEGGQASVYLCSRNKRLYAAKVYLPGASKVDSFKREVEFLSRLNFKYLINMVGYNIEAKVKLPEKEETTRPVLFLEFAEGGQLFDYIAKTGRFTPPICRTLIKMLIKAIEYLISVGVTHRDLKPENILFDKEFKLKVSDFGLSTLLQGHEGDEMLYTKLGTEGYKPPEMELGKYTGVQADLFATGVILFVMYTGTPPFLSTKNTDKIYRLIREKNFAKFWALHEKKKPAGFYDDSFKRLLNSFFSAQVEKRPTLQSLKEDEWLNGDQALQDEITLNMTGRYEKMLEDDVNKQNIEKAKLQIFQSEMQEDQCMEEEDHRSIGVLHQKIQYHEVKIEQLPVSNKCLLIPTKVTAPVLIAWFENYIKEAFEKKNVFIKDPCFSVSPQNYNIDYEEKDKVLKIDLMFRVKDGIEENEEETVEELSVNGHLVQLQDGKVSVDWQKVSGNAFWLSSLICELNLQMKALG